MAEINPAEAPTPLISLHIPRTGGTTLQNIFINQYSRKGIFRVNSTQEVERWHGLSFAERSQFLLLSGHMVFELGADLPHPVHAITFLRDPVARVVSAYQYIRSNPKHSHHQPVKSQNLSLAEYIRARVSVVNIDNGMTRLLSGVPDNLRQVGFGECTSAMLDAAKNNLSERMTVVGLTEKYDASLVLLQKRFGWKSPLYTTKNVTNSKRVPLDPQDARLILRHNELDMELYSFARKLYSQQMRRAMPAILYQVRYFEYKNRVHKQDPRAFEQLRQFEYRRIARWLGLR